MTNALKNANKGLTEHWGKDAEFDIKEPRSLGYFDKQTDVFSAMVVMNVEGFGKRFTLLVSLSNLHINKRLVYVYGYRRLVSDKDAEILRDFTKKWTSAIISANKDHPKPNLESTRPRP